MILYKIEYFLENTIHFLFLIHALEYFRKFFNEALGYFKYKNIKVELYVEYHFFKIKLSFLSRLISLINIDISLNFFSIVSVLHIDVDTSVL